MTETAAVLGVTPLDISKYYGALRLHGFLVERCTIFGGSFNYGAASFLIKVLIFIV